MPNHLGEYLLVCAVVKYYSRIGGCQINMPILIYEAASYITRLFLPRDLCKIVIMPSVDIA
ncbi:Uncharacterised protein [Zhongshania aliphaticivorans]|nr:Uncharacterised protein [Zhongshania aliphaticivorans]